MPLVPEEPSIPLVPEEPSVPLVPELPSIPEVPEEPSVPLVPDEPSVPLVPELPSIPEVPLEPSTPEVPLEPSVPLVPDEPDVPVFPVITTVIFPPPSSITDAPLNVIPETLVTGVPPSPTDKAEPDPEVIPVIDTTLPSLLFNVNVDVPLLYVPPVTVPVNPVIVTVPPSLSYKAKDVVAEKYVPPVIAVSFKLAILHLAFSLVTPLIPSIVEPVQAFIRAVPPAVSFNTEYPNSDSVIEPSICAMFQSEL